MTRSDYRGPGRSSYRHYRRYPRHSYGLHLGYWGYWGPYYYGGYYPYYGWFPTLYYGPYTTVAAGYGLGAVDLNVKPKKTEVWVDGQLVGRSGKFDGFPGYLWLSRGKHELIFHHPGYSTEMREVRVLEGAVVKLNLRMQTGETVAPEKLSKAAAAERRPEWRREKPRPRTPAKEQRVRKPSTEPGRLLLAVEPEDASIYLDGRFLGTAGELGRLHAGLMVEAGQHTLEIVRPEHEAERFEFSIEPGEEQEIAVALTRR